ncbi:MAG: glycosyltransferase family 4 protein [Acidobacteriia bacterium]|nr:glycosyltransferase family 4 protein [Terriglobia bacterium]
MNSLQRGYPLTDCYLPSRWTNPFTIWRQVRNHDLVFGWFASWHSFLPLLFARLLRRPSLLIIGGYDVAAMPEIGYGHQRGGIKKWVSRWDMRLATCLVTHSHDSAEEAVRNAEVPKVRIHPIYLGVEDVFRMPPPEHRQPIALTVGNVDWPNLRRKGHEPFVRAAAWLPDVQFVLVGAWLDDAIDHLRTIATPNVVFAGRVDDETLRDYYWRASVYVQASAHEGFGLSVAEAMLAGCIPVVTRIGALPEVVGEAGLYAGSQEPDAVADVIREALVQPEAVRLSARQRILHRFPMAKRREALDQLIDTYV